MTARLPIDPVTASRRYTLRAITTLKQIMLDPEQPAASRIAAAKEMLRWGWSEDIDIEKMSDEDLQGIADAIMHRRKTGQSAGNPGEPV